jgi:hypothetical protein
VSDRPVVTDEQAEAALARFKRARVAAGLPELVDDERTLRIVMAVIATHRRRRGTRQED